MCDDDIGGDFLAVQLIPLAFIHTERQLIVPPCTQITAIEDTGKCKPYFLLQHCL